MGEHSHRHIIGIIASPAGLMIGYQGDERLMRAYGGREFPYCPMCTRPNNGHKASVIEFDDGDYAVRVGDRYFSKGGV